ncbi:MAG TPA: endonuclease/exonuclease/phosphatase family protein [Bryobacteraceae bacterium]|nr:endonuclease/exonuclease/phosphatase family protein [Bryobacteraceae bacterium]
MKRFLLWMLPLLLFVAVEGQTGSSNSAALPPDFERIFESGRYPAAHNLPRLRLMTWNIDHGARLDQIAAGMQTYAADLYLLQEVDSNTTRDGHTDVTAELSRRLGLNGVFAIEFEELSQEHNAPAYTGQATLSRLPFLQSRILRFERQSGFWKPRPWIPSSVPLMQRRRGGRLALVSEFDWDGRKLVVYNAHLESRSAGFIQEKQLDEILADASRYPPGSVILLGGDLNTKYLPSIFLRKLEAAGFQSAMGEHIERTHRIMMALDWIFAKGPVRISDGAIEHGARGSDHYPLCAILERSR